MKPVSVTQVNEYIAKKLREDYNLRDIVVEGEISGLSMSGGNVYFTLKDSGSQVRCNIWSNRLSAIDRSILENGKKIVIVCDISPYARGGYYSLSVKRAEASGTGDAMAEFNRVKALLEAEGLFDRIHKQKLPAFPRRVGIITSSEGAAVEDIKKIITQKNNYTDILIFPTVVQGQHAVGSIIKNISLANRLNKEEKHIDILIVGRGGGSPEDLAAFNDEGVARAVFASEIPVISAVGHESDFSISDFTADVRAETPTAAADMAVMDTYELRDTISGAREILISSMKSKIEYERHFLKNITDMMYSRAVSAVKEQRSTVEKSVILLREADPRNIFRRGYAAVFDEDGRGVSEISAVHTGNKYRVVMQDGSFSAEAISTEREKI